MDKSSKTLPPAYLYKYVDLSLQTLKNLKGQVLYFGSPIDFNDLYDCALTPKINPPSDEEVEIIRRAQLQLADSKTSFPKGFETLSTSELREALMNGADSALKEIIQTFNKTNGATCFSENKDDLLMWAHYGGSNKGLCLEFSTAKEPLTKIIKVKYTNTLPNVDLVRLLINSIDTMQLLFCTKSIFWEYEYEWRAFHAEAGTEYGYPPEALTGVYFGPDIDRQSLEIVCLILRGQNEHVKFWEGTRSTTEYKVQFKEFTYKSHLEAKKEKSV